MSVYYIPQWLLLFAAALAVLAFWYHSITITAMTFAANVPKRGYCSFMVLSWALLASTQIASFYLAYSLGANVFSDPLLNLIFLGSAILSLPTFFMAFQCFLEH
jgi:hypothetical protein